MSCSSQYSRLRRDPCTTFIIAVIAGAAGLLPGCFEPDQRTVRGALDAAARACEANDARALFSVVDRRGRDALFSIAHRRRLAAALVRTDYPEPERATALRALGDGADAKDAADLFAKRCPSACLSELAARLGAPVGQVTRGDELEVRTAAGATLRMYRGQDGLWGVVWHTDGLSEERTRAWRELVQIEENAAVYRRRRALETGAGP
jgi:hypothetical protein